MPPNVSLSLVLLLVGLSVVLAMPVPGAGASGQVPRPSGAPFLSPRPSLSSSSPPGPLTWSAFPGIFNGPPRSLAAVASYTALSEPFVAVVGGSGACGRYCDDVWTLSLNAPSGPQWFEGAPAGPVGRAGASLGWDAADGELVLFGGLNGTLGPLNQTWWKVPYLSGWNSLAGGPLPPPRWGATFTYDPALGGLLLFGGDGRGGTPLFDTWLFRGNVWSEISTPVTPPARWGASMIWQGGEQRMVLFGGNSSAGTLSDTWAFGNGNWYQLHPSTFPPARSAASMNADAEGDPVIFGGWGRGGPTNDTWIFFQNNWSEPSSAFSPPPMSGGTLVPNSAATPNDFLEVLGREAGGPNSQLWSLRVWNGGTPLPPLTFSLQAGDNVSSGTAPLSVGFDAFGEGGTPPYAYAWNFGDGSPTSASGVVSHTYGQPGDYLVTLRVTDSALPPQTMNRTFPVLVSSPPSSFATSFNATPRQGSVPLQVAFAPALTGGTAPFTYRWGFGDGSSPSSLVTPTHTFDAPGVFLSELEVNDSAGRAAQWAETVVVSAKGLATTLTASPLSGVSPLTAHLSADAFGGLPPFVYLWSFGNGNSTVGPQSNVTQVYAGPGNYKVNVTVIDSTGTTASASLVLTVAPPPPIVTPPLSWQERLVRGASLVLATLLQPVVAAFLVLCIVLGGVLLRVRAEAPLVRAVRRAAPRRRLSDLFLFAEIGLALGDLRQGYSLREVAHRVRPLLSRDARTLAEKLRWRPGPRAIWLARRLLLLPPQLLAAMTVLFLGLVAVPEAVNGGSTATALQGGPLGFLTAWWAYSSGLFTHAFTSPYLEAYLPYTLQLMFLVVAICAVLSYPLGMLAGWYRGGAVDHSTRAAGVLANSLPVFVAALLFTGWAWTWYYTTSGGDSLLGSLPSVVWDVQNMGGIPSWVALHQNTLPTGFVLVDAPLHGAWAFEEVVLLKMLLQAIPVAAVYSAIFLRYARVATQEAAAASSNVGARARGVGERGLLWTHTSRRIAPTYVEIFGATFPVLLSIQMVAEWFYGDFGIGRLFVEALGSPTSVAVSQVAFVLLVMVFVANVLGDTVAKALDPLTRGNPG